MDQHPIPQDVTGFQFKLIGTMTVKQFGYVAIGAILAAISWYLPFQGLWSYITKIIFVPFFGLSGVIIAFVPIEGRPIDIMAKNFFRTLTSPNQYIYIKKGRTFSFTQVSYAKKIDPATKNAQKANGPANTQENIKKQQLQAFLAHSQNSKTNLDKKEDAFLDTITTTPTRAPSTTTQVIPTHINTIPKQPTPKNITQTKTENLETQETKLQQKLAAAKQQEVIQKNTAEMNTAHQKVLELQKQIQDTHTQKEQLEQELLKLKNQLSAQKPTISPATLAQQVPHQDVKHVRNIPQNMTKNAGLSQVSDTPNVIVGIVKDARGNILPNILVEVKDKDGNPVRAFKTNPLGQFLSATPLTNNTYTIELEDPKKQHAFDAIQVVASGQIMLPIEIIGHDAREELRKALFN